MAKVILIFSALFLLFSCSEEGGYIAADDLNTFAEYARYNVTTDADSVGVDYFSQDRFKSVKNIRMALVWDMVGRWYRNYDWVELGPVDTDIPYQANFDLKFVLPDSLLNHWFIPFGKIWYYVDGNDNGQLDKNVVANTFWEAIPDQNRLLVQLDSLRQSLQSLSTWQESPTLAMTIELTETGITCDHKWCEGLTLNLNPGLNFDAVAESLTEALLLRNRWDLFFKVRGGIAKSKINCNIVTCVVSLDKYHGPAPDQEVEFIKTLQLMTQTLYSFRVAGIKTNDARLQNGVMDSLFLIEKNRDWIMGMSRDAYLVYIPNDSLVSEMISENAGSAVSIEGAENFKPGYNLVLCRIDGKTPYKCKVGAEKDSIEVLLLSQWAQFIDPTDQPTVIKEINRVAEIDQNYINAVIGTYGLEKEAGYVTLFEYDSSVWIYATDLSDIGSPWDKNTPVRLQAGFKGSASEEVVALHQPLLPHNFDVVYLGGNTMVFTTVQGRPLGGQKAEELNTDIQNQIKGQMDAYYSDPFISTTLDIDPIWSRNGKPVHIKLKGDSLVLRDLGLNILDWTFYPIAENVWKSKEYLFTLTFEKDLTGAYTILRYDWADFHTKIYATSFAPASAEDVTQEDILGVNITTNAFEEGSLENDTCGNGTILGDADIHSASWSQAGNWNLGDTLWIKMPAVDSLGEKVALKLKVCSKDEVETRLSAYKWQTLEGKGQWAVQGDPVAIPVGLSTIQINPIQGETSEFWISIVLDPLWKQTHTLNIDSWTSQKEAL